MMAGNPSWWSMDSNLRSSSATIAASDHHHHHNHHHNHHQEVAPNLLMISQTHPNNSLNLPEVQYLHDHHHQHAHDFPHSWSQLLLGGLGSDHQQEERFGPSLFQSTRVMNHSVVDVKQEVNSQNTNNNTNNNLYGYNHHHHHEEQETAGVSNNRPPPAAAAPWSHSALPASSPKSCVTSLSSTNNILDFSTSKRSLQAGSRQHVDHSNSECNSTATGGASNKKPRVQSSSNPPLKVRKEKLGDRITALHQLVSPFGKTDTASVLLEAIGYIRFLQAQIEALSSPYLGGNNASAKHPHAEERDAAKDLKSRGLCLVPISCTQLVESDNGADYWAPSLGGGF